MTMHEETVDLEEELDRLREQKADLVEKTADLHPDDPVVPQLESQGNTLDTHIAAVEWAREKAHTDAALPTRSGDGRPLPIWNEPAEQLTFGALSGGEIGMLGDRVKSKASANDIQSTEGLSRVHTVAFGTVDAPYHDPEADRNAQIAAASQLPYHFQVWAESVILDLSMLGNGSEQSFAAAVRERRTAETTESDQTTST